MCTMLQMYVHELNHSAVAAFVLLVVCFFNFPHFLTNKCAQLPVIIAEVLLQSM